MEKGDFKSRIIEKNREYDSWVGFKKNSYKKWVWLLKVIIIKRQNLSINFKK